MGELLIELGLEELPTWAPKPIADYLKNSIKDLINQECETFYTPRRIVIYFQDFDNSPKRVERTLIGPPMCNAFDDSGPTKALLSFLERANAHIEDVKPIQKGGGLYASVLQITYEEPPLQKLSRELESLLSKAPMERSMVWNDSGFRFVRPIRWILALYSDGDISLEIAGVKSSSKTYPHRLESNPVEVKTIKEYFALLDSFGIILSESKRIQYIRKELSNLAKSIDAEPYFPDGLDMQVANLVESPYLTLLKIDEEFLKLPEKVIMTVLAHHQRFFCVKNQEKLLPYFIAVSNSPISSKIQ
ncbi:MAG: glycine--tRNA ligase subunit beta, partial [Aquificaceae bacterium]|nr:glycine--tRNA ligase subunit beta [Aquificaceae bacterium]